MTFTATFKTPDAADDAVRSAVNDHGDADTKDDIESECETLVEKFVKYGEYVTIEFDTTAGTAKVVPVK